MRSVPGIHAKNFALEPFDEGKGFFELREERFVGLELARVNAATHTACFYGMFEMKHFVIEEILDGVARARWPIEDAADNDGVVGSVIVAQRTLGIVLAPGEVRAAQHAAEEAGIQRVEDLIEMKETTLGAEVALASAGMADEFGLPHHGGRGGEALVAKIVGGVNGSAVELGKKDVRDCVQNRIRRALKQVGKTDVNLAFTKADGGVQGCESPETDVDGRHGCTRTECAIFFLEYRYDVEGHEFQLTLGNRWRQRPAFGYSLPARIRFVANEQEELKTVSGTDCTVLISQSQIKG